MIDLITLDCYKENKEINSAKGDGRIQTLITQVSALIEHYCNRKFTAYNTTGTAKVEWNAGKTNKMFLEEFPVISVTTVKTSNDGGVTQTTLTEGASDKTGYFVDLDEGSIFTQISLNNFIETYDTEYRSLEVVYRAGYEEIPEDLKLCTIDLVHYYVKEESVGSKSIGGASLENALPYTHNSFPPHIRRILDLYRAP